jgi:hypothetical protein
MGKKVRKLSVVLLLITLVSGASGTLAQNKSQTHENVWGPKYRARSIVRERQTFTHGGNTLNRLRRWNGIAIDASGLDHTPVQPGEDRVFGEQVGPGRAARAMAIVHIAIFDAINAIEHRYHGYTDLPPVFLNTSVDSAIAKAAHDTLAALFPSQADSFDEALAEDLDDIPNSFAKLRGIELGRRAAARILALRAADGSQHAEPRMDIDYFPGNGAGEWRQDPISLHPLALGGHWGEVAPFVLSSPSQFRVPPPPSMTSFAYRIAYNEVKLLGGDGIVTPTFRTPEQTVIGIFWAYDGTPSLCAPPRLYNQITLKIAETKGTDSVIELARLLALVNTAMADAGIAVWESKYFYKFWRPVTGIRESDPGTGPTGDGDGNPGTIGDITFSPLGAPASNLTGPNFTPPFPAYPSGHAGFGGALFQTLRRFYGTDRIRFNFISDEFNGVTEDNQGNVRPLIERTFSSLSQAEEENGQSRIYLGIHWRFDKTEGIAQGRRIANYVFDHAFRPRHFGH